MNKLTLESYILAEDLFRIRYVNEKTFYQMDHTHFHIGYELYYVLAGKKLFFINDELLYAQKGDLVIIHPFDVHKTSSVEGSDAERIVVHFNQDFIADCEEEIKYLVRSPYKINLPLKEQLQAERILHDMLRECKVKEYQYEQYTRLLLQMFIIMLERVKEQNNVVEKDTRTATEKKIVEIATYINKNYQMNLSLQHIATVFFISTSYLSRTFKKVTRFNVSEYIQLVRIREAQYLLRETDSKIIDIAERVGFNQIAHFNKVFKKMTNTSPVKFRQTMNRRKQNKQS
ncbi:AraC family transcriptional regulator [Gracilibacillus marinus]|uniref:AraC family transcriptional regulator n=1 Tax=Gracilibacillus marinus TaxID=630535 RepID=A0ABV8VQG2_9BACI